MLNKKLATAVVLAAFGIAPAALITGAGQAIAQAQNDRDSISASPLSERWYTRPSEDVALDFSSPGLVSEVSVKEGDSVKKGQILAKQDVSVEAANKAMYEIEANSAVEEEYAQKDLELKKVKFKRTEDLYNAKPRNATFLEVEEARLEVERADASVKLARQKRQVSSAQAATEQAKIDLKQIKAPFDGMVSQLDTHVGEVANSQADRAAIRVVKNDPLWVDAHLPAAVTARLKKGQQLQVRYAAEDKWAPAEVLYLQPKVRGGSQTRMVRLQVANPDDRPAGLEVYVKLPDGSVAGADAGGDSAAQSRAGVER